MGNRLLEDTVTLPLLRELLEEARKNVSLGESIRINLKLWYFAEPAPPAIKESIGVYRDGTGEGTANFTTLKDAQNYVKSWKEKDVNGNSK